MKVTILGAGVIGVSSAYYLAKQGFEVTVIDRQGASGLETSFANAGQISPGYSTPWAAPGIPLKALKWLFQTHSPLSVYPDGSVFQLQWLAAMLMQCKASSYEVNKERMLRLAQFSRDCLQELRSEIGNHYEGRQRGTLQVFRTAKQLEAAKRDVAVLERLGIEHALLSAQDLSNHEPALAVSANGLVGGLRLPGDETGDCNLFTQDLTQRCQALGVKFLFGQRVESIAVKHGKASAVTLVDLATQRTWVQASDHVVACLGSHTRNLIKPLGIDLPVYPLKGYSLTLEIDDTSAAPQSTVMDEAYKVAVTRFDKRIRVGGMAEVSGFNDTLRPQRKDTLAMVVNQLFPGAANTNNAKFWTGLRPMTPDSTPVLGATPIKGLWLNTGHGTLGWTMACGSGKLLSEMMAGKARSISAEGLDISRYSHREPAKRLTPKPQLSPFA